MLSGLAEKAALNAQKTADMRKRHLEERRQLLEQTEEFGMSEMENELQRLEDDLDANQEDELFCVACNKELRNEKAFAAHRNQKKHLENVRKLKETMMEEDLLNSDDLKDSDQSEAEVEELEELQSYIKDEAKDIKDIKENIEEVVKSSKVKSKKKQKTKNSGKDLLNSDELKDSDQSEAEVENLECEIIDEPKDTIESIEEVVKPSKGKSKKKRKAKDSGKPSAASELQKLDDNQKKHLENVKKKSKDSGKPSAVSSSVGELQCAVCKYEFKSKNKLFNHLKETGHAVPPRQT